MNLFAEETDDDGMQLTVVPIQDLASGESQVYGNPCSDTKEIQPISQDIKELVFASGQLE